MLGHRRGCIKPPMTEGEPPAIGPLDRRSETLAALGTYVVRAAIRTHIGMG
jgi:hypothetical protein